MLPQVDLVMTFSYSFVIVRVIMAALHGIGQAGHYIFMLLFLFSSIFLFLAKSQRSEIRCLLYFDTWCGPSANLECRSERRCTRLAANAGHKNVAKNRHLGTIAQLCRAISSQLRQWHVSTIGKKLKQQYLPYMSPQYGELWPTSS